MHEHGKCGVRLVYQIPFSDVYVFSPPKVPWSSQHFCARRSRGLPFPILVSIHTSRQHATVIPVSEPRSCAPGTQRLGLPFPPDPQTRSNCQWRGFTRLPGELSVRKARDTASATIESSDSLHELGEHDCRGSLPADGPAVRPLIMVSTRDLVET